MGPHTAHTFPSVSPAEKALVEEVPEGPVYPLDVDPRVEVRWHLVDVDPRSLGPRFIAQAIKQPWDTIEPQG